MSEPSSNHSTDAGPDAFAVDPLSSTVDSPERLERWAELIAVGDAMLPTDLNPTEIRTVLRKVGRLRRRRMVRLVARAIAQELADERGRNTRV